MAINLSVDVSSATFADLAALVEAARAAGVDKRSALELDGTTLVVRAESPVATPAKRETGSAPLGDAAIRSVIDILNGRLEPPRP
ncbi:hypothetical protein [Corynebacterium sanguinis]|uniref:hypothetical protein n=1 Tax=Corynebacterium sanguinis TaxID=2594913 RepID=UPI0021A5D84A|nr:hypothetical protein [Corynebacterium sanguinis]MCT1462789.1 hypothetical protein [Corynebacterium sanguinis]MCT2329039.1 hypothetical protein [Corynebacterium sanguinis]